MPVMRLMRPLLKPLSVRLIGRIVDRLVLEGTLAHSPVGPRLPDHRPRFGEADEVRWRPIETILRSGGIRSPSVLDIARQLQVPRHQVLEFLTRAARLGRVIAVTDSRFLLPEALARCEQQVRDLALAGDGVLTAVALRDATGLGRNLCIELLEYFNRQGLTQRDGDLHRVPMLD
jgi:selenocysteine-specific elongation factor